MVPIFSRFGADFFTVYADFSRFVRDINGEKKKISLLMIFFTVSFSRFAPLSIFLEKSYTKRQNLIFIAPLLRSRLGIDSTSISFFFYIRGGQTCNN